MFDDYLFNRSEQPRVALILAHGAGQPMDSGFMEDVAGYIVADEQFSVEVVRFNFPYMTRAMIEGRHRPPDRGPVLEGAWMDTIESLRSRYRHLFIGGKSLGGRIASVVADRANVNGVVCFGYPFHPPGKPERLRTAHLETIRTPVLVLQGERDPFGNVDEVGKYTLSQRVTVEWLPDGDHGFKPRKSSGVTLETNLKQAAATAVAFMRDIVTRS